MERNKKLFGSLCLFNVNVIHIKPNRYSHIIEHLAVEYSIYLRMLKVKWMAKLTLKLSCEPIIRIQLIICQSKCCSVSAAHLFRITDESMCSKSKQTGLKRHTVALYAFLITHTHIHICMFIWFTVADLHNFEWLPFTNIWLRSISIHEHSQQLNNETKSSCSKSRKSIRFTRYSGRSHFSALYCIHNFKFSVGRIYIVPVIIPPP